MSKNLFYTARFVFVYLHVTNHVLRCNTPSRVTFAHSKVIHKVRDAGLRTLRTLNKQKMTHQNFSPCINRPPNAILDEHVNLVESIKRTVAVLR